VVTATTATLWSLVVLGLFVPVSIAFFFVTSPQRAAVWTALGFELFMPEIASFKFPLTPALSKHSLPYVCILIGCLLRCPAKVTRLPRERWFVLLTFVIVVGGLLTWWTNRDLAPRPFGWSTLPGLDFKDGCAMTVAVFITTALPFYLGYALFRTEGDLRMLLAGFAVGAFIYIPLELWEIRMSPNLHKLVYGFFQDSFEETRRWGGYRPLVFMKHGLALARFSLAATMAAFVFGPRPSSILGIPWRAGRWILTVMLVLCKSTGAVVFAALSLPLLLKNRPKRTLRVAGVLAAIVLLYPALRLSGWFPTAQIAQISTSVVGADRTQSMTFRFENEELLLARARERVVFGWGSYGRNFAQFSHWREAVTDGHWIIVFGMFGVVGFVASFGMLTFPIFLARKNLRAIVDPADKRVVAGTGLILAILAVDLLPNGMWGFWPYLLAGAFTRVARELVRASASRQFLPPDGGFVPVR
jgi:hypothetical protein